MALLQGLGDLAAACAGTRLRGLLRSREWAEAQRIGRGGWKQLPELAALIRRLGRAERAARPPPLPPPQPQAAAPPRRSA
jgi:hypothetical protein